ncbi:MAG: 3-deoxy-D-manno-octulosonic acid transferase [Candidatus Muirbacterium halophilum]|nr:3-deoxy-D-manno-octulosonic acid transferase [Candidatus Muirbacterium halophilum]MCK9476270.1 3-deoxy-D-manno-octulosonic acid transferase [Candidatus Muirbacterium halophilum]
MYNVLIFLLRYTLFKIVMLYLFFADKKRYMHLKERMKFNYFDNNTENNSKKNILVHAVSVGEVVASTPLIEYLLSEYSNNYNIVISTVTTTGKEMVEKTFGEKVNHVFFPLDFKDTCKEFIRIIKPHIVLIAETEIWPNFMNELKKRCIPAILFNGRISPSSYKNYYYFRRFFRVFINYFDVIAVQSQNDSERIIEIGAKKEKVFVMGNLKFDSMLKEIDKNKFAKISYEFAIPENRKVIIAGSVHDGEYEFIINSFVKIKEKLNDICLIIAPRHIKECEKIYKILDRYRLSFTLKTQIEKDKKNLYDTIILDTIGELQYAYGISDIAFIGGSIIDRGGHNTLEATRFGIPVFFGKSMYNFEYIAEQTLKYECGFEVNNSDKLSEKIIELYNDAELYQEIDHKARTMINNNMGSIKKISGIINKYL